MSRNVVSLSAIGGYAWDTVGHKAANLAALFAAGFPVPAGICLTIDAFNHALAPFAERISTGLHRSDLAEPEAAAEAAGEIRDILAHLELPGDIVDALASRIEALGDGPIAVRSSATAEDQPDASFAGQYDTILAVHGFQALHDAILDCWRSYYGAHAIAARATLGLSSGGMGVLIQPMVEADCAGVCYSVDPVQMRGDLVVISAAWGTGAGVVDGAVPADTYWLRRESLELERRHIVEKTARLDASNGELRRIEVPKEQQRATCLPDAWARRIGEAAMLAEQQLGIPQDIEWAIAGEKLWILQCRPLTGLHDHLRQTDQFPVSWEVVEGRRRSWSLGSDCRTRAPLPLEHDYHDLLVPLSWDDASRFLGADYFVDRMIVNGRCYYAKRSDVLQPGDVRVRSVANDQMRERLLQEHGLTGWDIWGPEIVAQTEKLHNFDRQGASNDDLATHLEDAMGACRRHWMLHSPISFPNPETYFQAYAALTKKPVTSIRDEAWALAEGTPSITSEMIDELYALGLEAREHPEVAALVRTAPANARDALARMPEAAPFLRCLDAFLDRFGERNGTGRGSIGSPVTPTWQEDSEVVLAMIAPYLDPVAENPADVRARAKAKRAAQVERLCAACPDPAIVEVFRRQYALALRLAEMEETHNHYIDQLANGQLRLATLEAGRRLAASGTIDHPDDIWWLHSDEIIGALRDSQSSRLMNITRERQADHARWERLTPPPVLGAPEQDLPPRPPFDDDVEEPAAAGTMRGQGGSRGRRSGPARLIAMGETTPKLRPGDVLVARNAGPAWTPYFPILAGVVLDQGSFGQHSASTAREYGIPLVFGTRDGSERIPDGTWITVDGSTGIVELSG